MTDGKIVITEYKGKRTCFFFKNGEASEVFFDLSPEVNPGDIYIGRVSNVRKDLKACFVEIKPGVFGFLPEEKIIPEFLANRTYDGRLKEGDEVAVTVEAEPIKTKQCLLSMNLSVAGSSVVAASDTKEIFISHKLDRETGIKIKDAIQEKAYGTGFVIRTNADRYTTEEIVKEAGECSEKLRYICESFKTRTLFSKLYGVRPAFTERIVKLALSGYPVVTDDNEVFKELSEGVEDISFYNDNTMPLKVLYSLEKAYTEATSTKIMLRSGGFLMIEPTEALTVIDVNSGKSNYGKDREAMIKATNIEACDEIFRQLQLRNISGIIIIDFINYANRDDEAELIERIEDKAKKDPIKTDYAGMTRLGLVELTRKKKYLSIYDQLKRLSDQI